MRDYLVLYKDLYDSSLRFCEKRIYSALNKRAKN